MGLGPEVVRERVADSLTKDVDRRATLVVLINRGANEVLDAGKELVIARERDATAGDVDVSDLEGAALEHDDAGDDSVLGELLTVAKNDGVSITDTKAVNVDNAGIDAGAKRDLAVAHLERIAVVEQPDILAGNAYGFRELSVSAKVDGLAVDRHEVARMHHGEHELELLLATVTGNVHDGVRLIEDLAADLGQRVDDALNALLVTGNGRGGDDDGVALADGEALVLAVRHAGERGEGLALTAGAEHDDLVLGDIAELERIKDVLVRDLEIAELAGNLGVGHHGTTGHDDLAADRSGGIADLLETVNVTREARDEHTTGGVLDNVPERGAHRGLAGGEARDVGVRGIRKQQVDALLGKLVDGVVVGRDAIDGRLIELEVARVHDGAGRRLNIEAECAGNRVRHRKELERKAAETEARAISDLAELRTLDVVFGELTLDHAKRELARKDGHLAREVHEEVRERARVVLVAVGNHDTTEFLLVLEDIGVVRKNEVDSRLIIIGEHKASVDEDHVIAALERRHVLSDAIKAAKRDDLERRGL